MNKIFVTYTILKDTEKLKGSQVYNFLASNFRSIDKDHKTAFKPEQLTIRTYNNYVNVWESFNEYIIIYSTKLH